MQSTHSGYGSPYLATCHFTFTFFSLSLNNFIMTMLVDLYSVMGAAMLVRAESELWDLKHANSSSTPERL